LPKVAWALQERDAKGADSSTKPGHLIPVGGGFDAPIPFDTTQLTSAANRSVPRAGDPSHPLAAHAHAPAIAFGWQNSSQQGASASASVTPTLDKSKVPGLGVGMRVRRLTPLECERLQGFLDGWTDVPYRGKPAADGPRYRALGNSMAVNVMRWIGERINDRALGPREG